MPAKVCAPGEGKKCVSRQAPDVVAISQNLSALGAVGLSVLDLLARGAPATEDWKTLQLAILQRTEKPTAQLLLVPAPAVQRLVEAAASGGGCASAK